jgi:hypothetical protein
MRVTPCFGASYRLGKAEQQGQIAVDAFQFKDLRCTDSFPDARNLDQYSIPRTPFLLIRETSFRALETVPAVSKLMLAGTSVETRPGITLRISDPKSTKSRSINSSAMRC